MAPSCLSKPHGVSSETRKDTISSQHNHNTPPFADIPHTVTERDDSREIPPPVLPVSSPNRSVPNGPVVNSLDDSGFLDISDDELDDLAQIEGIWLHSLSSEDDATPPPPCSYHQLPKGSCPSFKTSFIEQINECRAAAAPNMDGARVPLLSPSFPAEIWRNALATYFDADELVAAITFGWDSDFTEPPRPKDASQNNSSAL